MAGKRQTQTMDHMMYNKLARVEMAPQCSITCPGETTTKDLQACKNLRPYPLPGTDGQISSGHWSSATTYQQYAGNTFNLHLQTNGVSEKCQRPEVEMFHNPMQQSDNANNHFSVHQNHPVPSYHMSPSRACPPIVMPRPVYRSSGGFMDAAYGTMGVCVGSQPRCPPAGIGWRSSAGFGYPSSYASCVNKPFSTANDCPEIANCSSSLLQGLQEQNLVNRHRVDMGLAVGVSPTCSKEDVYTDNCHTFTPSNVQLVFAEGTTPIVKQRNSAFNMPSYQHQSYKPTSLNNRMGLYSNSHYSNRVDGIHQKSFPCNMDIASSPHSIRGGTIYPIRVQKMQSGYVNTEQRMRRSYADGNLQKNDISAERDLKIGTSKTNTERQYLSQSDKDLWVGSAMTNREVCVGSTRGDRERLFDMTRTSNCLQETSIYGGQFEEQSAHVNFLQQNSSSNIMPDVSVNSMMANRLTRESSITSKMSALHSALISLKGNEVTKLTEQTSHTSNNIANMNVQHAKSSVLMPGVASQCQKSDDGMKERPHSALLDRNCDLSVTNTFNVDAPTSTPVSGNKDMVVNEPISPPLPVSKDVDVDADGPNPPPLPVNKDVAVDRPKSPPMPVINDVFSLAPYCAYLEGKNSNFPMHQDWDLKSKISTSLLSQRSLSPDKTEKVERECSKSGNVTKVNIAECSLSVQNQHSKSLQTGEPQGVSYHETDGQTVVLDLSLKKSAQTSSPPRDKKDKRTLPTLVIDNCPPKPSQRMLHEESQESYRPRVARSISLPSNESSSSRTTDRLSYPGQNCCPSTTSNFYKGHKRSLPQATDAQPCQLQNNCSIQTSSPSQAAMCLPQKCQESYSFQSSGSLSHQLHNYQSEASDSLPRQLLESYPLQVTENLRDQFQKNCPYQATKSMPRQLKENYSSKASNSINCQIQECAPPIPEDYPSQAHKSLTRQIQENDPSHAPRIMPRQLHDSDSSQAPRFMPSQLQNSYSSQATKSMPYQLQENYTSQAMEGLSHQLQENNPSWTKENMTSHGQSRCMSTVSTALPVDSSPQHSNNISVFVNNMQTSINFMPQSVMLKLHSLQQHQSIESSEHRARTSLGTCSSMTSPSESDNEANGFHSSKSFMFRKYKMMKFSSSAGEAHGVIRDCSSRALPSPFPLPSDAVQSLPPSAPESSPTLGESNVSLASVGELAPNGSRKQFTELHRSVRVAIIRSIDISPSTLLEDWVTKSKEEEKTKTPVKNKNGSRSFEHIADSPSHDIWLAFDGVRLLLHKLLSQLETFMFTRSCPFPHVIRAGAIFIPIYLVKEVLFPELLGPSVDRILQKHKVELRPTTLSEEKLLRETELKDCPSRMLKLLALKQLPDMYPDLLNLFCGHSMQQQLGSRTQSGQHTHK
ncbi:uncharacterized protein C15orf39 homolog isoform X2 [Pseudophryne corroboree]|uniref:uncharacterized protein C15orf39 homolog isoform X2 n=1 Tax=Pseudophryne corroboree TaxID=495146 RepID=UPI003081D491